MGRTGYEFHITSESEFLFRIGMAEVVGLEPTYAGVKDLCLTAWRHFNIKQEAQPPLLELSAILQVSPVSFVYRKYGVGGLLQHSIFAVLLR